MPETCESCARVLHTGEGRILMSFSLRELVKLAEDTLDLKLQDRLYRAIGLIDAELERILRES